MLIYFKDYKKLYTKSMLSSSDLNFSLVFKKSTSTSNYRGSFYTLQDTVLLQSLISITYIETFSLPVKIVFVPVTSRAPY